jgi:hypothetical protein
MKKMNQTRAAATRQIPPVETKMQTAPLPPHQTIRKVQTPSLGPEFSRLYLASLIGRQRS